MKKVMFSLLGILLCIGLYSNTIYVPQDYSTIQLAINAANINNTTIIVDDGIYVENLVIVEKNLKIESVNGSAHTIIDGNYNGSVVDYCHAGLYLNTTNWCELTGFTIINGHTIYYGGGINAWYQSHIIFADITIKNNVAELNGGGLYFNNSEGIFNFLNRCSIYNNESYGIANEIYSPNTFIDVVVDTFMIEAPTSIAAYYEWGDTYINCGSGSYYSNFNFNDDFVYLIALPSAAENVMANIVKCYPNPACSELNFFSSNNEVISIYNVKGQLVKNLNVNYVYNLNIENFNRGIYFYKTNSSNQVGKFTIIK